MHTEIHQSEAPLIPACNHTVS